MARIRRKTFISYHHDDQEAVDRFINTFDQNRDVFIARALGFTGDIIKSTNTNYIMSRIRDLYLRDSTVMIVLIGKCTWARRYVDWELQSSLRRGETIMPNGLLGIVLPSARSDPKAPERLGVNLPQGDNDGYARWYHYPQSSNSLATMIEDAYRARTTRANLIKNPRARFLYNRRCP